MVNIATKITGIEYC